MEQQINDLINKEIEGNEVCLFMKGTPDAPQCGFSMAVSNMLKILEVNFKGVNVLEDEKFKIVNNFIKFARFDKGEKITIDGLRVNFEDGWGLLRASNTTPKLVLRFEAKSQKRLIEIQNLFLSQLKLIDESIEIKIS